MEIRPVDPRDVRAEFELPDYRVYFWKKPAPIPGAHPGAPERGLVYAAHEYELTGCHNVREVFAWADENAGSDRSYTLYAVVGIGETLTLIRLFGIEPTKHKGEQELDWPGQVYL